MAGVRDLQKRGAVRKLLRSAKWQSASDRAVSREAGVSKVLVAEVRQSMIALGQHPPLSDITPSHPRQRQSYRPGSRARGGCVFDEHGRIVPEVDYLLGRAKAVNKKIAAHLQQVLDGLREHDRLFPNR